MDNITSPFRVYLHKALVVLSLCFAGFACLQPAQANPKYAAFVVHADTGDILFDRYSTQPRYPASLTKMMTLYLLFEELESGGLTLESKLKVSSRAAGQPPSKLGVGTGSTIDVESAIKALIVKSANDVAVVVAERLGRTESQFARKMTEKARAIGMRRTTFRNASGLPNSSQLTTARDLAELSRRVYQDFPQYRHYFTTKSFSYGGRTYTTHNSLVKNYPGADGLKTGYTRRSGFNLATTATRGEHRLIGIVLGGRSSYTRDKHMREILDTAFANIEKNPQLISALHHRPPFPRVKPPFGLPGQTVPTIADNPHLQIALQEASRGYATTGSKTANALSAYGDSALPDGPVSTSDLNQREFDRLAALIEREDNSYAPSEGDIDPSDTPGDLTYGVQIGAYSTEAFAKTQLEKAAALPGIAAAHPKVLPLSDNGKTVLYRARFLFPSRDAAESGCDSLKQAGIGCFVTDMPLGQY